MAPHGAIGRLRSLDMLRAIAALLVVMFHTQSIFGKYTGRDVFYGAFAEGNHGVDLFFVLSGFVVTCVHRGDWDRPERLGNYLFNRASRIYPGVWIISALALGVYLAGWYCGVSVGMAAADPSGRLHPAGILASALLLPQRAVPLLNVTWTLKYEMFFYAVFALLIVRRRCFAVLLLWQGAALACALLGIGFADSWARYLLGPNCVEFGIGMACAGLVLRRGATPTRAALPIAALLLGTATFLGGALVQTYRTGGAPLPDLVIYGVSSGLIVGALARLELSGTPLSMAWLVTLGEASYSIYLVHFSVIMAAAGVLLRQRAVPMHTGVFLATAVVAVGAGVAFHRFIDQPIQRALRRAKPRLLGPRPPPRASPSWPTRRAVSRTYAGRPP